MGPACVWKNWFKTKYAEFTIQVLDISYKLPSKPWENNLKIPTDRTQSKFLNFPEFRTPLRGLKDCFKVQSKTEVNLKYEKKNRDPCSY